MFIEAFEEYCSISDNFDSANMRIEAYLEGVNREFDINREEAELKVLTESGTEDDLAYLYEEANEGALAKVKKAIQAIIEAFKKFCAELKAKVLRLIVNAETKAVLKKVESKVKLNPFLAKKKVKVIDKKKPLKVISDYKSKADKHISKVKAGVLKESEITSMAAEREKYDRDYKAAVAGTAALVSITVAKLIADINAEYGQLPGHIDRIDKDTSAILENFFQSLDKEEQAAAKAAYTACANFRSKLAKDEANEHVDAIMNKLSVLKKEVLKVKDGADEKTEVKTVKESFEDSDLDGLFDGFFEEADTDDLDDDYVSEAALDANALLDDLDDLLS